MSDPLLDISTARKLITDAAEKAAANQIGSAEAQRASTNAQANLTVALHAQTELRVQAAIQNATTTIGQSTNTLMENAVRGIQDQTTQRLTAATQPIEKRLEALSQTARSNAEAINNLAGTLKQSHTELAETMANIAKLVTNLATAQREAQQQYVPQQTTMPPQQYLPTTHDPQSQGQTPYWSTYQQGYQQGYGQPYQYGYEQTASSQWGATTSTSTDIAPYSSALAQAAANVALQTCRYSGASRTADSAQAARVLMDKHLTNLTMALKEYGWAADAAGDLVLKNQIPKVRLKDWQQELVYSFIGGITYGQSAMSGLDLVAAYGRLTFASSDTMRDAVGHDERLWNAWVSAVKDAWVEGRETTLLTHHHDGSSDTYLARSGGGGAVFIWNSESGRFEDTNRRPGTGVFLSFDAAALKSKGAHERSQDADRTLLECLYEFYKSALAGAVEMVTSIAMCPSCTMVALQFLHACPHVTMKVRATYVPAGYGGKEVFYQQPGAGSILKDQLVGTGSVQRTDDDDRVAKKPRVDFTQTQGPSGSTDNKDF